jgi:glucan phosphoethanolaminetransferase (alkaline phosphatase superfamily)
VASALEALLLWGVLLIAASRRSSENEKRPGRWIARALFVIFLTFSIGGQSYFYQQYNAYLNVDVSRFATNFADSIISQLLADFGNYLKVKLPVLALGVALVWLARHVVRPSRRLARRCAVVAPVLVFATFFIPTQHRHVQAAVPDMLYMHSVGGLIATEVGLTEESSKLRPRARESLPVPPITTKPALARNVVFVILESVRSDAACVEYDPTCQRTGATNRLFPNRIPLDQVRSLDSSTAISLAVLWSGVGPHESRDVLHTWPLVFDYAKAAGYKTAFWTSQNMMFGNARLWVKNLGVDSFFSATDVDPTSDIDLGSPEKLFAERAVQESQKLEEPFFAVVQLSNVHYPYYVDPEQPQPFQPSSHSKAPERNGEFFNYYQNAVHQQDAHLAKLLAAIRASKAGERTVIVYTSDHAEAFREHGQMGHTFSTFDEEVKVPGWIDAPPGTLTEEEERNLRQKSDTFLFHPDLTATVLDLMGVWKSPQIAPFRERMLGESLLEEKPNQRAMPMTNCAGVWSCAFENWGYMRGHMKLEARAWDSKYHCYDLSLDPHEQTDLGEAACGDLHQKSQQTFERLPGKKDD